MPDTSPPDAEPFGRQPQPVRVTFEGATVDVEYWMRELMQRAEFKGDIAQKTGDRQFTIYPMAVNN